MQAISLDAAMLVGTLLLACGYLCGKVNRRNLLFVVVILGTQPLVQAHPVGGQGGCRHLSAGHLHDDLLLACGMLCDKVNRRNLLFVVVTLGVHPACGFQGL